MESKSVPAPRGRSSQYHVVAGLSFLEAFKRRDMEECMRYLHPQVEWHPTPTMADHEVVKGRDAVRYTLEAFRDRYTELAVDPEDGRQVGDYMLLIGLMRGKNAFHGGEQKERACWVVTMRDDLWVRIVVYGNPAWARVGFEELLRAAKDSPGREPPPPADPLRSGTDPHRSTGNAGQVSTDSSGGDRLAVGLEESTTPAPDQATDSGDAAAGATAGSGITLELAFDEAEALARWLLRPSQDGALAGDDPAVKPGLMKLRAAVEREQAVRNVRHELEQAGIQTQHLSDQQVVQLGRRISTVATTALATDQS